MKGMGKDKKIYWVVILVCIVFVCGSFAVYNKADAINDNQYTDMYRVDNGIYDEYTDTLTHGDYTLETYADDDYASTVNITWGEGDPDAVRFGYIYTIEGDDPITQFVPRELFLSETEEPVLYIGREYGFLVDTFRPSITNASGGVIQSDNLHSTVMLFTVDTQDNMVSTGDHLKLTIAPIFQAEFAYVERTADGMFAMAINPNTHFLEYNYQDTLDFLVFPSDGAAGYVVPVAEATYSTEYAFTEYTKYYLTDIGCTMSLYNVNHPNADDAGYVLEDDYGAYFSQTDIACQVRLFEPGSGMSAADYAELGVTAGVGTYRIAKKLLPALGVKTAMACNPWLGVAYAAVKTGAELLTQLDAISEDMKGSWEASSNELTYTPLYTDRAKQISEFGQLNKDLSLALTDRYDEPVYLGAGDSVTFDYQLAYGNSDIDTRYASALYISAVSVTGSAQNPQFGEPISAIGVYSDMLTALAGYTEKIEVGTNEETEVYILPGKNNIRYFTPTYDGPYTFTGDDAYARLRIAPADGTGQATESVQSGGAAVLADVWLTGGKEYALTGDLMGQAGDELAAARRGQYTVTTAFTPPELTGEDAYTIPAQGYTFYTVPDGRAAYRVTGAESPMLYTFDFTSEALVYSGGVYWLYNGGSPKYLRIFNLTVAEKVGTLLTEPCPVLTRDETADIESGLLHYVGFTPDITAYYRIETTSDAVTAELLEPEDTTGQGYWLHAGQTYYAKLTGTENIDTQVRFVLSATDIAYGQTAVTGDPERGSSARFTAPIGGRYIFSVPAGAGIDMSVRGANIMLVNAPSYSVYLNAGEAVYLLLSADTAASFDVTATLDITEAGDTYTGTLDSDGVRLLAFSVTTAGFYEITASPGWQLYNSTFEAVDSPYLYLNPSMGYILRLYGEPGAAASFSLRFAGQSISAQSSVLLQQTTYYNFTPEAGVPYIFETYGDTNKDITTQITVLDGNFGVLAQTDAEKYVSLQYTGAGEPVFIRVEVQTAQNYTCLFSVRYRDAEDIPADFKQAIVPYELYNLYFDVQDKVLTIAQSGNFTLYIAKNQAENIHLFRLTANGYVPENGNNLNDAVTSYSLTLTAGDVFSVGLDNTAYMQILLLPADAELSVTAVSSGGIETETLLRGNTYTFKLADRGSVLWNLNAAVTIGGLTVPQDESGYYDFGAITNTTITCTMTVFSGVSYAKTFALVDPYNVATDIGTVNDTVAHDVLLNATFDVTALNAPDLPALDEIEADIVGESGNVIKSASWTNPANLTGYSINLNDQLSVRYMKLRVRLTYGTVTRSHEKVLCNYQATTLSGFADGSTLADPFLYLMLDESSGNKTITFADSVLMATISGNTSDLSVVIADRDTPFILNLNNAVFNAKSGSAIEADDHDTPAIAINCTGNNTLTAASGERFASPAMHVNADLYIRGSGQLTLTGASHIKTYDEIMLPQNADRRFYGNGGGNGLIGGSGVYLYINKLTANGGDGAAGRAGEDGADARDYTWDGEYGFPGGDGGHGAAGIFAKNMFVSAQTVLVATGGDGGQGGPGGNGGHGANGVDNTAERGTGGAGSDGGNGGVGGQGGNGGYGLEVAHVDMQSGSYTLTGGDAGLPGKGGDGGNGGDGGSGGPGRDGEWFGATATAGGTGGAGGDGGDGGDAGYYGAVGVYSKDTLSGGSCQNGNKPEIDNGGLGGSRGEGGAGGPGGETVFGNREDDGAPGAPGDPGEDGDDRDP